MKTRAAFIVLLVLGGTVPALAHRLNEYLQATTIAVRPEAVTLELRLTPGVDIADKIIISIDADHDGVLSKAEAKAYAEQLRNDLSLTLDGRGTPLQLQAWSFASLTEMAGGHADSRVTLMASLPGVAGTHVLALENRHDRDVAAYLVNALQPDSPDVRITAQNRNYDQSRYELTFSQGRLGNDVSAATHGDAMAVIKTYAWHGLVHILTGYDHLLFLGALVFAAVTLWDLVKVVTAFTLAHSMTLTLAALNVMHLPSSVVEPFIAASIVFVAVQNIFWPGQAHGRSRLAIAFFFGLFHGLGFAGGLLEIMHHMPVSTALLAILGFSIGVEAGNQTVLLPLFATLRIARVPHRRFPPHARYNASVRP